jgi:hypothetical protein
MIYYALTSSSIDSFAPRLFRSLRNLGPLSFRIAFLLRCTPPKTVDSEEMRLVTLSSQTTLRFPFSSLGKGAYPTPSIIRMEANTLDGIPFAGSNSGEAAVA